MAADLSSLLTSSKALTSHFHKPGLPQVNLSLDQIEAQSRRLVSRQPGAATDSARANYLLAQAHVDAPALANSIAHLNTTATFSPLQPLQDTDIVGYLRHAHEQNIISTIEEARRETQEDFYRLLEDRSRKDWEALKKRVFEELGGRMGGDGKAVVEYNKSHRGRNSLALSTGPSPNLQTQNKMMNYDHPVTELNAARLRGVSYPILHSLAQASRTISSDPTDQMTQNFHILAKITGEPPSIVPIEHQGAHILNTPLLERKLARAYLGDSTSRDAVALRRQIARGAREALEEQYIDVLERTIQARPLEAQLGGDPSAANKVRAFLLVRYYRNGEWQDRIELVASQPLWAKLFYLVRIGHAEDALVEALRYQQAIEHREESFVFHFRAWLESPDRRLPKAQRDHIQSTYNAHMLHSTTGDPFKLALYKLMGKLDPSPRTVPLVTATTEDWLWFQLTMVDEEENGGLATLADTLLGYGQRQFEGPPGQQGSRVGLWAAVLLVCGQFERAVAALWDSQETEVEAVHMAIALAYHGLLRVSSRAETSDVTPLCILPTGQPALSLPTLIWRYVRQFVRMDPKEALQYVYAVTLSADQPSPPGVGQEQCEHAWELVRRIVVLANSGPAWDELVGGFRADGTRFTGAIEQGASLLRLTETRAFNEQILLRAAGDADRPLEAIKLYNLAGAYERVVASLAHALGGLVSAPSGSGGEAAHALENTAREIVRHYERTNRAAGRERDAVVRLLRVREALDAHAAGRPELALDIMEATGLVPLENDVAKTTRRAEEFRETHEALQRALPVYLPLTMDCLAAAHQKVKAAKGTDAGRQMTLAALRGKSRALMVFAGMLKYRLSPDVYSHLARLDVEIAL